MNFMENYISNLKTKKHIQQKSEVVFSVKYNLLSLLDLSLLLN